MYQSRVLLFAVGLTLIGCTSSPVQPVHDAGDHDANGGDERGDSNPVGPADAETEGADEPRSVDTGDGGDAGDSRGDATDDGESPNPTEYVLVGTYLGGISAFAISPDSGALEDVAGSPFVVGAKLYGLAVDPSGTFVYAIDLDRKVVDGYRLAPATGVLTAVEGAHAELSDGTPLSIAMDPQGRFIYVATTGDNEINDAIHGFSFDKETGALSPVDRSPFVLSPFVPDGTVAVDPAGRFLYVTGLPNGIRGFSIDAASGALSELPGSPFATTAVFRGALAFHPSGDFLYNAGPALNAFRVDQATGALTVLPGSPVVTGVGSDPTATTVAIDPRGRYLYVVATFTVGPLAETVSGYAIDATTGVLTPVPDSPFAAAPFPYSVAVDRDGRFLYVGNDDSDEVSEFSINQTNGSLSPVGAPFVARGLQPEIVTVRPVPR